MAVWHVASGNPAGLRFIVFRGRSHQLVVLVLVLVLVQVRAEQTTAVPQGLATWRPAFFGMLVAGIRQNQTRLILTGNWPHIENVYKSPSIILPCLFICMYFLENA